MFEFIRTHQKLMQILLAILIVPSFVLVGVSGYKSFGDDANTLAKIDGHALTRQEWEQAQRKQLDMYRQRLGQQFDQKMFDTPEFRQSVLDQLITERAITAEAARNHLTLSPAKLQKLILEAIKDVPGIFKPDGSIDMEVYRRVLAQSQGLTPEGYQQLVMKSETTQQVGGSVALTGFVPHTVAKLVSDFGAQEREVQELAFPAQQFMDKVKVTDEMVKAFYEKNSKMFETPEQAKIEYVVFNAAAVSSQVTVSDEEVAAYYNGNAKRYTAPEQRRASQIMVALKPGASAADKAAAKAKAEAILAEVKKAPADFAKVAKAKSEDPVSAPQGGDMDVLDRASLPKSLGDAAFAAKQGDIIGPIETEFGFHIVTITSLKPESVKPLAEVKEEIAAELKNQKAGKKYSEMAEAFTNTVYEQADSLKPVVDKLKLEVKTADVAGRTPSPAAGQAPYNNAKFLTALFSDDVLKNKRNTEAVEVAPSTLVSGRIVEYKPAAKRPLADVEPMIRQRVQIEESVKLAKKEGEAKLAAAKANGSAEGFAAAKLVSRANPNGVNQAAAAEIMKADVSKLPAYVGVEIPGMGYGVYRIGKVQQPAQQDAAQRQAEEQQISGMLSQQELYMYVDALKQKAKVKMLGSVTAPAKTDTAN
ncbi:SurA N-terminal domain-containing protein [Pseudoduganella ginsengisoli]|uniref:Periplasmic chaperone PpiD n=1 Tax=Pseudoduganella ginsengisoli TaxID=1462440 RepID=A0A6L6Q305_9BURK|nr:SurA N-terminal domain-containing protein [Pseudoduganella ginsengisoli]MTW04263.1 peptidylprolyl isomerase [Pseudoduganella ginsengisoli]